jgi:hypothetical protein
MTIQRIEAWMENTIRTRLQEQVAEQLVRYSFEELRDRDVLQSSWWEKKVDSWLAGSGITISVGSARWESPDADRAEKERVSRKELKEQIVFSDETHKLELELAESEAVHQAEIESIRAQADKAKSDREHEEKLLQLRREIEIQEEQNKLQELRAEREAGSLAAEAERARLNQQEEQARQLEQMKQELLERNQREIDLAKMQLADQLTQQLQANPEMLEQLEKDACGGAGEAAEDLGAAQKAPEAPAPPAGKHQEPPPLPGAQLGKKDKIKAMDEARAKARTADAQDMMQQFSEVYNNAATAKLAASAAGDSTESNSDYKRISRLFGGAAGSEKEVDTPKGRGKSKVKVEATPEKVADDKASDGLADRLQQMFGSSPGQAPKTKTDKTDRSTDKPDGTSEPIGRKRTHGKAKAEKPAPSVDKEGTEALQEKFVGLFGPGKTGNRPSGAPPSVDDRPPHAAEDVARVGVSNNSTPDAGDDQDDSAAEEGDRTGKSYDTTHFSRMFSPGESKKETPKVHSSDKGYAVFNPESFLKKGGQSSQESQESQESQDDADPPEARNESGDGDGEDTKSSSDDVFAVGKQSSDKLPEKSPKAKKKTASKPAKKPAKKTAKKTVKKTKKPSITPKKNAEQ